MFEERELIRGNTPTMILAVLRDEARHGYAILGEVNRRMGDALKFKQGTLYPVLYALEGSGFIVGQWEQGEEERPRKVYHITPAGTAELERRLEAWKMFTLAMERVIGGAPDEQTA
jgi:PadR family transcriptional regulator, regulatory protein PadR